MRFFAIFRVPRKSRFFGIFRDFSIFRVFPSILEETLLFALWAGSGPGGSRGGPGRRGARAAPPAPRPGRVPGRPLPGPSGGSGGPETAKNRVFGLFFGGLGAKNRVFGPVLGSIIYTKVPLEARKCDFLVIFSV